MNIKLRTICTYLLFISIVRPVFISSVVGAVFHIGSTLFVVFYVISKKKKRLLWNPSLIICASVIISSVLSFFIDDVPFKYALDGILFSMNFYALCTLFLWYESIGKKEELVHSLFRINLVYCIIALLLINKAFGFDKSDSNLVLYIFGNKFSTAYLFIMLAALFYSAFRKKIRKNILYKLLFFLFFSAAAAVCLYYNCKTALVVSFILLLISILPEKIKKFLFHPAVAVITVIVTTIIPFLLKTILANKSIQYFITNVLHRSLTLSGRTTIYNNYLLPVLQKKLVFGYGYTNSAMKTASIYYATAQNGMLQWMIRFGIVGAVAMLVYIYLCFRRADRSEVSYGALALVYMMLIAGIVEVSYDWHFFIGLALIPASYSYIKTKKRKKVILNSTTA